MLLKIDNKMEEECLISYALTKEMQKIPKVIESAPPFRPNVISWWGSHRYEVYNQDFDLGRLGFEYRSTR